MLIPTVNNTRNITDFRNDPDSILDTIKGRSEPLYLLRGSTPKAVILDIEEYIRLREYLEDYEDSLVAMELERNPEEDGITFDKLIEKYNLKGKKQKNASNNH